MVQYNRLNDNINKFSVTLAVKISMPSLSFPKINKFGSTFVCLPG